MGDAVEGGFWLFEFDGEVTGVVVQADAAQEGGVFAMPVEVEAKEFERFA